MKNENKMRGRGVQFGLKRENQSNPKSKNQKKMTLRRRGIEVKKLNKKRREKERKKRKMKREREKEGEEREKRGEKGRMRKLPARPPTEKLNVTTHPVAPANYIMIFNGLKSKTRPSKIFGSGISWDGLESSEMS